MSIIHFREFVPNTGSSLVHFLVMSYFLKALELCLNPVSMAP